MTTTIIGNFTYDSNTSGVSFSKSFKQFFEKSFAEVRVKRLDGNQFNIEISSTQSAYDTVVAAEKWAAYLEENIPTFQKSFRLIY